MHNAIEIISILTAFLILGAKIYGDVVEFNCDCGESVGQYMEKCNRSEIINRNALMPMPRAVGGCPIKDVIPWFVLILTRVPGTLETLKCGATLINKFWIISAAHCFCNTKLKCKKGSKGLPEIDYNVSAYMTVHFIVTDVPQFDNPNSLKFTHVVIHEKYNIAKKKMGEYDFALARLSYPLGDNEYGMGRLPLGKFDTNRIMPLCLPPDDKFQDTNLEATTVGMGTSRHGCITNDLGPEVYTRCAHKWVDKNRAKDANGKYTHLSSIVWQGSQSGIECVKGLPPPSSHSPLCSALYDQINANDRNLSEFKWGSQEILLVEKSDFQNKKAVYNLTSCFKTSRAFDGWCGTCNIEAKKGTPGYCTDEGEPSNPLEIALVEPDKGWGFCSTDCSQSKFVNKLQMANLYIVDDKICQVLSTRKKTDFAKAVKVNTKVEICAAFAKTIKPVKTIIFEKKGDNFTFEIATIPKEDEEKFQSVRTRNNSLKGGQILGGVDTCQGDSGGPLWVLKDKKHYLVGVVSRGRQCGSKESPGIYGRVKMILPWIKEHTMKPHTFQAVTISNVQSYDGKRKNALKPGNSYDIKPFCEANPKRAQLKGKVKQKKKPSKNRKTKKKSKKKKSKVKKKTKKRKKRF